MLQTNLTHTLTPLPVSPPLLQFDLGNLAMVTGGHNNGRVGTIVHKEKHRGGHDIVHIEDSSGNRCAGMRVYPLARFVWWRGMLGHNCSTVESPDCQATATALCMVCWYAPAP